MNAISLVTGTYNRLRSLKRLLDSVNLPPGIAYEWVIVDGGSTDGTLDYLRSRRDVLLIEHGELRGAIDAFTDGARAATGRYVALLNDDVAVLGDTLLRAMAYLEDHPDVGAVAFADNRGETGAVYTVAEQPARDGGRQVAVPYIQCGLVRKHVGDALNWWRGLPAQRFGARTYGGDNLLSSNIYEHGYQIATLPECRVHDYIEDDALRQANGYDAAGAHPDSSEYYRVYPTGPLLRTGASTIDRRRLRVLYLPIYDQVSRAQKAQKRGLREALARVGWVAELDYLAEAAPGAAMIQMMTAWTPDVVLTQLHSAQDIQFDDMSKARAMFPRTLFINWNGDYWPRGLIAPDMIRLLSLFDLQLTVNASVLDTYRDRGIAAAYWQIAYEPVTQTGIAPAHDVVFLGNCYSDERRSFGQWLKALDGVNVGIYGTGWGELADGECNYDFEFGAALYRSAKIALGDNQYPDAEGYVSNRLFEALASGGCLLLHQRVSRLGDFTGLLDGTHYVAFDTLDDCERKIRALLADEATRRAIASLGTAFVRERHSFDARVRELLYGESALIRLAKRRLGQHVALVYRGPLPSGGTRGAITNTQYSYRRNEPFVVDKLDADYVLRQSRYFEVVTYGD